MKKFLSLVLALVMTMSLVTISAGATEYKDLTDKNEIKYAEAVAVMNKIGIISGYADGSVKPAENLTRGAAAKIVTYMMVGAVAGEQLGVANKPYKDVALDNPFAPYIAYCKSTGLINGFSDGTFRSGAPLDGYSYSKMLLTAMGYKSEFEGFTGAGWQTNVASRAVKSGLYTGNDAFIGSAIVTREEACLYALNLMESAVIEYPGQPTSTVAAKAKMENEAISHDYNSRNKDNGAGYIEFCEVHYPQLKLTATGATDDFNRPSNQWAYKNVIIGTYAVDADFTFTAGIGDKNKDADYNAKEFGLKGYHFGNANDAGVTATVNGKADIRVKSCQDLATLVGNGTVIELFLDSENANVISDVVVIRSQIMQVNAVNSSAKTVTLKKVEDTGTAVNTVKEDDAGYAALSAMKADDYVLITPVYNNNNTYSVAAVAVPTTATGKLSKVNRNSSNTDTTGITVAGTDYKMAYNWTAADGRSALTATSVNTKRDATVYVDSFGYAIYVKDVAASTSYILYDDTYTSQVDGKIHYFANGFDLSGNALSLDFGTTPVSMNPGKVYAYTAATKNSAEYAKDTDAVQAAQVKFASSAIGVGNSNLVDINGTTYYFASDVKFIFANVVAGTPDDLDGITVKDGVQAIKAENAANMQCVLNKDKNAITTVIVANDKDVEVSKNVLYVSKYLGSTTLDGKTVSRFDAYIDGVKEPGLTATKNIPDMANKFFTYAKDANGNYELNNYNTATGKATSVISGATFANTKGANVINKAYVNTLNYKTAAGANTTVSNLRFAGAQVIDLTSNGNLQSFADMADYNTLSYTVSIVYNGGTSSSAANTVSYVFITDYKGDVPSGGDTITKGDIKFTNASVAGNGKGTMTATYTFPTYAAKGATVTVTGRIYVDGANYELYTDIFTKGDGATASEDFILTGYPANAKLVMEDITFGTPSTVVVKYYDGDTGLELAASKLATSKTSLVTAAAGAKLSFTVNTTTTGNLLTYTTTGLYADKDGDTNVKTAAHFMDGAGTGTTVNDQTETVVGDNVAVRAMGNDFVKVTINNLSKLVANEKFAITSKTATLTDGTGEDVSTFGAPAAAVATLKLTASPNAMTANSGAVVAGGSTIALSATLSGVDTYYAYVVSVKIGGSTLTKTIANTTATTLGTFVIGSNIEIQDADVTVTPIAKFAIKDATWNLNTLTINFNGPVAPTGTVLDTAFTSATYTVTKEGGATVPTTPISDVKVAGNTVTLTFNANLAVANKIVIGTTKIESNEIAANKLAATTLVIAADNKVTVTI